ncbi:helix-turn-helix domain-containing protein [Streptomyces sp. NPDC087538]|uniref:helix-turn-helix domain-containing protein n=1 Tax=Streptomyces sp. NPDC087538 TaxID=3365797 RepID=UPI0038231093
MADRTGYSRTSWERYPNGRLLAPKGAVVALAEATGTSQAHLTTMREPAERAWSRSGPRQDMTVLSVSGPGARSAGIPPRNPVTVRFDGGRGWPAAVGRRRPVVLLAGVVGALLVLAAVVLLTGPGL